MSEPPPPSWPTWSWQKAVAAAANVVAGLFVAVTLVFVGLVLSFVFFESGLEWIALLLWLLAAGASGAGPLVISRLRRSKRWMWVGVTTSALVIVLYLLAAIFVFGWPWPEAGRRGPL